MFGLQTMPTAGLLSSFDDGDQYRLRRVKVYTTGGTRIGLAGLGQDDELLTFPGFWIIQEALDSPHWARFSTYEELAEDPTHKLYAS